MKLLNDYWTWKANRIKKIAKNKYRLESPDSRELIKGYYERHSQLPRVGKLDYLVKVIEPYTKECPCSF